ncbi:MAG: hypothetical protein Q4G30_08440 [Actinomycetaceae bacterium]|nr:hypothetical protein [Actinomycetaceae bacterium]
MSADQWAAVLARMEEDLRILNNNLLNDDFDVELPDWELPESLGGLPEQFSERVRILRDGQEKAMKKLEGAIANARKHQHAVDQANPHEDALPVYLNVEG